MAPNPPAGPPAPPPARPGTLHGGLDLTASDLHLVKRSGLDLPRLTGWETFGEVGMPALPQQLRYAVLPPGTELLRLQVVQGAAVVLPGPLHAYPVQPPFVTPPSIREPAIMPLDRLLARARERYPRDLVVVGEPGHRDGVQLVPLRIRPVQYDPATQGFVFYPDLRFTLEYQASAEAPVIGRPNWLDELALDTPVLIPDGLFTERAVQVRAAKLSVPCVIITDNTFWPESITQAGNTTRPPTFTEAGSNVEDNPVTHFERLAQWKTARGVRTRVVTIKDILEKKYGDCTEYNYARDLQEVIRNFIIMARREWSTEYVLLGGHPRIVPIRSFLGHVTCSGKYPGWDFYKYKDATVTLLGGGPPPRARLYCYNNTLLCHDSNLGRPSRDTPLVTSAGHKIAFKSASDGTLGWYFEDERFLSGPCPQPVWWKCPNDYGDTPKGTDICNIVVEGPKEIIDDDMHWALPDRLVPSDVYYAELTPPADAQSCRLHAFDRNGNGFYGEYKWNAAAQAETSLDGIAAILPDVKVGRAPILSGREAQHFVDKVLAYETLVNVEGEALNPQYLKRKLVVADVWRSNDHIGKHMPCWSDGVQPATGEFVKPAGERAVIVHLQPNIAAVLKNQPDARTRLVARFHAEWGGIDVPVSKLGITSTPAKDGWRFVKPSGKTYVVSSAPTDYVRLTGPAFTHKPACILWYFSPANACDDATTEAEELIHDGLNRFSAFGVERYLVESHAAGGPATPLNAASIREALDKGPHLVGVYGHGSENGLSYIYWHDNDASSADFRNADRPFIMYANSCLTANPSHPTVRSLGEVMVTHKNGAVAYVGYTRVGFSEGHEQQQRFWKGLSVYGRLGRAAAVRVAETTWQVYEQMLYGDPEMPVWTRVPRRYLVIHPKDVDRTTKLKVIVLGRETGSGLEGQRVTLMAGWRGSHLGPQFLKSAFTDEGGVVELEMDNWPEDQATLSLTVTPAVPAGARGGYIPYRVQLPVYGYQRGWRRCRHCQTLFHLNTRTSFCPRRGGGLHEAAEGEPYRVIANTPVTAPSIQQGWRWCNACQALHLPGAGEVCYTAGGHPDEGSGKYALEIVTSPDASKPAWRVCDKCRVLHLVRDNLTGPCHGGANHNATGSYYRVQTD